jgi:hypothetical protein
MAHLCAAILRRPAKPYRRRCLYQFTPLLSIHSWNFAVLPHTWAWAERAIFWRRKLLCELQRDWQRKDTVESFMNIFIETGGTTGVQLSYDRD